MPDDIKKHSREELKEYLGLLSRDEMKELQKEAIKEFLKDEKEDLQKSVGKWIINIVFSTLIAALAYFTLNANGWHHK